MNKLFYRAFIALFIAIIILPLVLMPWAHNTAVENRPLASFPQFMVNGRVNMAFTSQLEDYFQDHFFGRTAMIDGYNRAVQALFGQSGNAKVIAGREGWLYLEEAAGDYSGEARLDQGDMRRLILTLEQVQETLKSNGKTFIICIAPNKSTIYPQYMPAHYRRAAGDGNLERLMGSGLNTVDLRPLLAGQEALLYYQSDSHWNNTGARLAARTLLEAIPQLDSNAIFSWEDAPWEPVEITGDLAHMLYPADTPGEADRQFADALPAYDYIGRFRTLDDLNITTQGGKSPLKLFMMRDSFAQALIPYMGNAFSQAHFTRKMPLPLADEAVGDADVVVLEMAERRLGELLQGAPQLPAPVRPAFSAADATRAARVYAAKEGSYTRVYGWCGDAPANLSDVQVMVEGAGAWQAFPLWESALLPGDEQPGAFSLLLDPLPAGVYTVHIRQTGDTQLLHSGSVTVE